MDVVHAFDEHVGQIVARLDAGTVNHAQDQYIALGRREVLQLRGIERLGLGREMLDLGVRNARQVMIGADGGRQLNDVVEQIL